MDRAACPDCGYTVGLGTASDLGRCPSCGVALMLTCELRALEVEETDEATEPRRAVPKAAPARI